MGNRKKLRIGGKRDNRLRQKRTKVDGSGLMQVAGRLFAPDPRPFAPPTADEMFEAGIPEDEQAKIQKFLATPGVIPASNEPIIKVVPARVKGQDVGECYIHDDGQISLLLDPNAPKELLDAIKAEARFVGYNIETGAPQDGPA